MIKTVKKIISYIMVCVLFLSMCIPCEAAQTSTATASDANATTGFPQITSTSAIIMDAQSGQIIYEKNSHTRQYPASITKASTATVPISRSMSAKRSVCRMHSTPSCSCLQMKQPGRLQNRCPALWRISCS